MSQSKIKSKPISKPASFYPASYLNVTDDPAEPYKSKVEGNATQSLQSFDTPQHSPNHIHDHTHEIPDTDSEVVPPATLVRVIDLSNRVYQGIPIDKIVWPSPMLSVSRSQLGIIPKMDIAIAVAEEDASNEEQVIDNAVDPAHAALMVLPDAQNNQMYPVARTDNKHSHTAQQPNQTQPHIQNAATNNPISFKTLATPDNSDNLSTLSQKELAAEGLLTSSSLHGEGTGISLPDYEATPTVKGSNLKSTDQHAPDSTDTSTTQSLYDKELDEKVVIGNVRGNGSDNTPNNALNPALDDEGTDNLELEENNVALINDMIIDNIEPEELARIEDEKRKEKEAKLESYKQFVAEQESKVKIDYQGTRVSIEANALPSRMYFIMNALSAIIASYGLVINSAAVVIGAMLVAMMLGPISGVALALIDYRIPLLRKSLITVLAGGSMVVMVGFVIGLLHKDTPLTNEILSRTQPTSMDLMVALAGGTAGAYAMISPHLSVAVVGVAVATALVPPLAASGILFAHGEGSLGFGALLLAITNIVAIQFTNAMVLWFTGFRRLMEEDYKTHPILAFFRRNAVPLLLLVGIGGYLSYNLNIIAKRQNFENEVKETINSYFLKKGNIMSTTQFLDKENYQIVRAVISGQTRPSSSDALYLENQVAQRRLEKYSDYLPVRIQIRYMPVVVIDSSADFNDQINKTDAAILSNDAIN